MVIIRHVMDDYCFTPDLGRGKAFRVEGQPGPAPVSLQHRHISCMGRMRAAVRIIMSSGIREGIRFIPGAGRPFMNMESVKFSFTGFLRIRQPGNIRHNNGPFEKIIKSNQALYVREALGPPHVGKCLGLVCQEPQDSVRH